MRTTVLCHAFVTLACLAMNALPAQVLEGGPSEEGREVLPEEFEQPSRPGPEERAPVPDEEDVIEVEPVPNQDAVYGRLIERLLRQGAIERDDFPREYRKQLREWFGEQGGGRRSEMRDRADTEAEQVETIPAESLTRRLRTEQERRTGRGPDRNDVDRLREEYLRLVEQRIQKLPAEELRDAVIEMKIKQILADLEDLGRLDPNGLAVARSYLAAQMLMTEDIDKLREVSRVLSDRKDAEQD